MHVRGYQVTAASMVAELPADLDVPARAWFALGSPCVSVFVPAFLPAAVPPALASEELWWRASRLRELVEADGTVTESIRSVLDPVEAELWEESDSLLEHPDRWRGYAIEAGERLSWAFGRAESLLG
jgi:dipeptidase